MTNADRKNVSFAQAKPLDTNAIPILDLGPDIRSGDLHHLAKGILHAATNTGFFYIRNHGIPEDAIIRAWAVAKGFFALDGDEKATIAVNKHQRGWMATGMSQMQGAKAHDLKEVFFWGREVAADDPDLAANRPLVAPNLWPTAVFPQRETGLQPYYQAVCGVGERLMAAIAVSLGVAPDIFKKAYQRPLARGQLVYYPPSTHADEAEHRFGVAPHTDFGVLTLLLQDNSGGLQVRTRNGDWVEAPPIEGTLVCNIGDLLQRWSNDRFVSTVHRVINRSGRERFSIPVFFDPHTDTIIDPVDLGVSQAESHHAPVRAGEHIMGRNKKSFAQFKDDQT